MNIFYLHRDPEEAVKPMYNKHIVKMILETAQLLCTAHHELGNGENVPYKKTHVNHPSTVWVRGGSPPSPSNTRPGIGTSLSGRQR